MGKYFGTDGIRGKVFEKLTPELAFRVGNAIARGGEKIKVVIGKDTRISGDILSYSLTCGILAGGGDVCDLGIITTPGVAYITKGNFDYGVMITASHNPAEYNGIKIFDKKGEKIDEKEELNIENRIDEIKFCPHNEIGKYSSKKCLKRKYVDYLLSQSDASFDKFKIVVDCANGASENIAPAVFKSLGAEVVAINTGRDGSKINRNCGAMFPQQLSETVLTQKADLGFAFDGDADRLVVVDDKGKLLDGDDLLFLFAKYLKSRNMLKNDAIVVTDMSNMGLDIALKKEGINVIRTQVGDKYVAEAMRQGFNLGGEQCGHIIIGDTLTSGDGILAGILLLKILSTKYSKLSRIRRFKPFFQIKRDFISKNKELILKNEELMRCLSKIKENLADRGRILLRSSGTEEKIRLLIETFDKKEGEVIFKMLSEQICLAEKLCVE